MNLHQAIDFHFGGPGSGRHKEGSSHADATVTKDKGKGHTKRETTFSTGHSIETWYDKHSRNWVTMMKDSEGNQTGDADYTGHKDSAKFTHESMIRDFHHGKFDDAYQDTLLKEKYFPKKE